MEEFKYMVPEESSSIRIHNVKRWRLFENELRNIFLKYQYNEVIMPSFEYVDLYTNIDTDFSLDKMFQYINQEGKNVALRCDFTIPLARLYASNKQSEIARYSYFGKVYRKEVMHKGRNSEFYQCGIELINKPGIEGDKECMKMVMESLEKLPLQNVLLEIGSASFFHRLCELVEDQKTFTNILKYRNISAMKEFIKSHHFTKELNELLLYLPIAFGDIKILQLALNKITDTKLLEALNNLKQVYLSLENKEDIVFDLGMVPSMNYYTGLIMKGYSEAVASPIISGGRYDNLLPKFNCQASAIGFCFHFNHIATAMDEEDTYHD